LLFVVGRGVREKRGTAERTVVVRERNLPLNVETSCAVAAINAL
jgi:hypothetical protein